MEDLNFDKLDEYDLGLYKKYTKKSEIDKALHTIEGIIKGISIDKSINEKEMHELLSWCDYYGANMQAKPIKEIIKVVRKAVVDSFIDDDEKKDILWLSNHFKTENKYYDCITSDIQKLQGILHGILADGIINDHEICLLKQWIENNEHLIGSYPYDEINSLLISILADGKIDEYERSLLKLFFSDFVDKNISTNIDEDELDSLRKEICIDGICVVNPEITLASHIFCFTGESERTTRKEISSIVSSLGGIFKPNVTTKTNYLIIGNAGNKCWSFSCYGRKVEQAVNMRKKGKDIIIVHENDFWNTVEGLS